MLERVKVSAFKSLVDFDLKLGKFNCIIGLNGSGKSTVLQLLSYISSLFQGSTQQWLDARGWESKEVVSHFFPGRETIDITLDYSFSGQCYRWHGVFNWAKGICSKESFYEIDNEGDNRIFYRLIRGQYSAGHDNRIRVSFNYAGSILSALNDEVIPHEAKRFRDTLAQIDSHDLLSPKVLRSGHPVSQHDPQGWLDPTGEYLIGHIHRMDERDKQIITLKLNQYFKQVFEIPSAKAKLEELAPGEVMIDLYLDRVAEEASELAAMEASS